MFDVMYPLPPDITAALSGVEQGSLVAIAIGVIGLLAARLMGRTDIITPRAYGKIYGGAPGANAESKPSDR
jgi:hypothetical protein